MIGIRVADDLPRAAARAIRGLASNFGAAAVLPLLSPRHRGELIGTLAEDEVLRTDWPREEPVFFPRWVEMPVNIAA